MTYTTMLSFHENDTKTGVT